MAILFDMVDKPKKAFGHVIEHPKSFWGLAILFVISIIALSVVNLQSTTWAMTARFAQSANVTPGSVPAPGQQDNATGANGSEQTGVRQRPGQGAPANQTPQPGQTGEFSSFPDGASPLLGLSGILSSVLGILLLVISWLIIGTFGHFLGKLLGGVSRFGATFAVGVWTTLPFFFRDLTQIAFQLITKRTILYQGLSFLTPASNGLQGSNGILSTALASVDPFAIWFLVLLGIGVAVATRVKGWKAAMVAIIIFILLVGVRILPALFGLAIRIPVLG